MLPVDCASLNIKSHIARIRKYYDYSIVLWIRIFVLRSITYEQQKVTLFTMLFGYFAYCTHDEVPTVSFGRRQDTATERVSFSYVQRSRYN